MVAIGVQVAMVLTLVGVSEGMLDDAKNRSRGTGADLIMKDGGAGLIGYTVDMKAKYLQFVREFPGVHSATGTLVQTIGMLDSVTGIDYDTFNRISGGFEYIDGGKFQQPNDMIVDEIYARSNNLKIGDVISKKILNTDWRICGIVRSGKLSRTFVQLTVLQDLVSKNNFLTAIYVKAQDSSKVNDLVKTLKAAAPGNNYYTMEEVSSLFSVSNIPMLQTFIRVVIGLGVLVGFLVVFLSMYTAVLERTREIGILKSLGASPGYVLKILLGETILLAILGSVFGILATYGTRWIMHVFVPTMTQAIVPSWWPIASAIAIGGALIGAVYPGLRAAKQDAIEALAYD